MENLDRVNIVEQIPIIYTFLVIAGLVAPVFLIPIVGIIGYSEVIEEMFKLIVTVYLILKLPGKKNQIMAAVLFGSLLGISENIFYAADIFTHGNPIIFLKRFLFTMPMHIFTILLMVVCSFLGRKFIFIGFAGALAAHLFFNRFLAGLLV